MFPQKHEHYLFFYQTDTNNCLQMSAPRAKFFTKFCYINATLRRIKCNVGVG